MKNSSKKRRGAADSAAAELPLLPPTARARDNAQAARLPVPKTAAEALARLKTGNRRFVSGKLRHAHEAASWRAHLKTAQHPFATILACSDSRVPPELVFDQGFGDLFVIRVAGNIIAMDVVGSLAYAIRHLETSLVVVMGHESCGAVTAAVEAMAGRGHEPRLIAALVATIEPGLKDLPAELSGEDRVHAAVEANVRWSMRQLGAIPQGQLAVKNKKFTLIGAVYDIATGRVHFLE